MSCIAQVRPRIERTDRRIMLCSAYDQQEHKDRGMWTYTHAVSKRTEHVAEVEVSPFDRVDTGKEKAPLMRR